MKKVLVLLLMGLVALGAKNAFADAIIAAQQADGRIVNDVDVIFAGYVNKIVDYKNTVDFRLNNGAGFGLGLNEWGGFIDGKHGDIGVIGAYINRPNVDFSFNGEPTLWNTTGGVAAWTGTGVGLPGGALPAAWISAGNGSVAGTAIGGGPSYAAMNALIPTPNNKVDLFWAKENGDSNFGVGISYADNQASLAVGAPGGNGSIANSATTTVGPPIAEVDNTYARALALNVGLGLKNVGFSELDLHAGYQYGTFSVTDVTTVTTTTAPVWNDGINDNGIYTITLGALGQAELDKDSNLRMFLDGALNQFNTKASFKYDADNTGFNNSAGDTEYDNTTSWSSVVVNAGFGCNHSVNDGAAVVGSSLLATFTSSSTSATESSQAGAAAAVPTTFTGVSTYNNGSLNISWGANVDAKVTDWLKVRAGIRKSIFNRTGWKATLAGTANTITATGTADALAAANASFSTGFGVHWQNWNLNTTVTAASLETALSGTAPGSGIFYGGATGLGALIVAEEDLSYAF